MFGRWGSCRPGPPFCQPWRPYGTPSGGMFPFSNSAGNPSGIQPTPTPPVSIQCHDALTPVPFSVPVSSVIPVSGGGPNLQTAVNAAPAGANLEIQDSLGYDQISISGKTDLTISAALGQTPSITALTGANQRAILIGAGNSGIAILGLILIGNGNGNTGQQATEGIVNGTAQSGGTMASIDRLIIQGCSFSELQPTMGAPAIQICGTDGTLHRNVWIHGCTAVDCGNNPNTTLAGYGTIAVSGFTDVYVQNCMVSRSVIPRTSSKMRGFTYKDINILFEDCLAYDIGSAGENENFKHHEEVQFGTAVGPSHLRNCVAYNAQRAYLITLVGATMTATNCVAYNDVAGIAAGQTFIDPTVGTMIFTNGIIQGAGDGTAFGATVEENHNNVFNVAAPGKVLDPTDLTVDSMFQDPANGDYLALAGPLQSGAADGGLVGIRFAAGEKIIWCNA